MNIKFYQTVDNVHGTIYYTGLEEKIINTPFFNRLHDVNQSSTVYLTFPANRTKRYEHSLGTMQLTSDVFYNASVNSIGNKAFENLMNTLKAEFEKIVLYLKKGGTFIFPFEQKTLNMMDIIKRKVPHDIEEVISNDILKVFKGNCLLNFVPGGIQNGYEAFLFMCLLQALRLAGALHDVGHPPQSHIIEAVLGEIYDDLREKTREELTERQKTFIDILSLYQNIEDNSIFKIDKLMAIKTENRKLEHLHEMIGIQVMDYIVRWVFPALMEESIKSKESENIINILYYFTIIEFLFAIVRNKNAFWISLHNIIDGTIDTDRLDFVPRDSANSGMMWGKVDYKRLINTVKFGLVSDNMGGQRICICYSQKNIQQMDNLLRNRYHIFTQINYHHRSTKMASLYQKAVKILALEYLKSEECDSTVKMYFSDISGLWRTLELVYANTSSVLNLIQWNDSWLNGLLYKHLVEEWSYPSENSQLQLCCEYLKEIFLNEKRHVSLIKRNSELVDINSGIKKALESFMQKTEKELLEVQKELNDSTDKEQADNTDEQTKLRKKQEAYNFLAEMYMALKIVDWSKIELNLGNGIAESATSNVIKRYNKEVSSYIVERVKFSLGVGKVYVYDYDGKIVEYEKCSDIKESLERARLNFPHFYIYLHFNDNYSGSNEFLSKLRMEIGEEIGKEICSIMENQINFEKSK